MNKEERWVYQYPTIKKYLKNKIKGWSICNFFPLYGFENIAYYAITEITELILLDIQSNTNTNTVHLYDTFYSNMQDEYMGYKVGGIEQLLEDYNGNKIDLIVVCSLVHECEIISNLISIGIPVEKIVSIASIIYSVK